MAGNRTLKLSILADVDDLKKKLGDGGKEVDGFGGKLEKFGKVAAAAFAAAAAAAVAYAGKLAIDGVKAAIEDEAAQLKLANALKNVTGATNDQISAVEKQITKLSLATGVADDALRPAFQRLALATGNVDKAQKLLNVALDVSAATGKPLEAVTNALGKAYEGNTSALSRLGIGMGTAELKALGLEGSVDKLAKTFKGAADAQANTFQGRIERIKVAFDEAKETIGTAFLPILERLLSFITNNVVPIVQKLSDAFSARRDGLNKQFQDTYEFVKSFIIPIFEAYKAAFERIKDAVLDNKETFKDFLGTLKQIFDWANKYLVPLFKFVIVEAIELMARRIELAIRVIIPVVEFVANAVKFLINSIIDRINDFIKAYNLINGLWGGKDVQLISKIGSNVSAAEDAAVRRKQAEQEKALLESLTLDAKKRARITEDILAPTSKKTAEATSIVSDKAKQISETKTIVESVVDLRPVFPASPAEFRAFESGDIINTTPLISPTAFDTGRVRLAEAGLTVVVQAPSAIDEEGFQRAVVNALNEAANRGTGGGGGLRATAQVL